MVVKKYKKGKPVKVGNSHGVSSLASVIKDPIVYNEEVAFTRQDSYKDSVLIPHLLSMDYVVPFGFPTETYLTKIKNHVQECVESDKINKRSQFKDMNREQREATV